MRALWTLTCALLLAGCPTTPTEDDPPHDPPQAGRHPRLAELDAAEGDARIYALVDAIGADASLPRAVQVEAFLIACEKLFALTAADDHEGLWDVTELVPYREATPAELLEARDALARRLTTAGLDGAARAERLRDRAAFLWAVSEVEGPWLERGSDDPLRERIGAAWNALGAAACARLEEGTEAPGDDAAGLEEAQEIVLDVLALLGERGLDSAALAGRYAPLASQGSRDEVEELRRVLAHNATDEAALRAQLESGSRDLFDAWVRLQELEVDADPLLRAELNALREEIEVQAAQRTAALYQAGGLVQAEELARLAVAVAAPERETDHRSQLVALLQATGRYAEADAELEACQAVLKMQQPRPLATVAELYNWRAVLHLQLSSEALEESGFDELNEARLAQLEAALTLVKAGLQLVDTAPPDLPAADRARLDGARALLEATSHDVYLMHPGLAEEGIAAFEAALAKEPDSAVLRTFLAQLLAGRDAERMLALLREAVELDPGQLTAHWMLASHYINLVLPLQQQAMEAEDYKQAAELEREIAECYVLARPHLEAAHALEPSIDLLRQLCSIALFLEDQEGYERYAKELEALEGR